MWTGGTARVEGLRCALRDGAASHVCLFERQDSTPQLHLPHLRDAGPAHCPWAAQMWTGATSAEGSATWGWPLRVSAICVF